MMMTDFKNRLACLVIVLCGLVSALAVTSDDAVTIVNAYNNAFLVNTNNGSNTDGITLVNTSPSGGALTYNQGTFIGAANLLYRITGLPFYYQDAVWSGNISNPWPP